MKNKMLLVTVSVLLLLALGACQAAPAAAPYGQPRVISVTGQGQVYLTPDIATIFIGVHSQNENVSAALQENNGKAQAVAEALKALGVEEKDIQTSGFNVYPQQQIGPNGENTGVIYAVDNTVNVTVRDLTKLGSLLDTVVTSGANNINGIQFDVVDRQKAVAQARQLAIESARQQAEDIAKAAGVTLGPTYNISVYTNGGPVPLFEGKGGMAAAASQVPVAAGQLLISVDANISYEIR